MKTNRLEYLKIQFYVTYIKLVLHVSRFSENSPGYKLHSRKARLKEVYRQVQLK